MPKTFHTRFGIAEKMRVFEIFVLSLASATVTHGYDVKLGLLLPHNDDGALKYRMGYSTSASAVTIALDKVRQEQLLPDANIR